MRPKAATTAPPRLGPGARATSSPPPSCTRSSARRSRTGSRRSGDALANRARSCSTSTGPGPARSVWPILNELDRVGSPLLDAIRYAPIEIEPDRIEALASRFAQAGRDGVLAKPGETGRDGIVLANEVLDALPVHRVRRRGDSLREVAVDLGPDDALVEVEIDPSTPALADRLANEGIELVDGQTAEICLATGRVDRRCRGVHRPRRAPPDRLRRAGRGPLRPGPPARRDVARLRPSPGARRSLPTRRPPGPDRPCRRDGRGTRGPRRGSHHDRDHDPGRGAHGSRHRGAPAGDPGRSGHDVRGLQPSSGPRSCACWTRRRWDGSR